MRSQILELITSIHAERFGTKLGSDEVFFILSNSRCGEIVFVFIRDARLPEYICKISRDEKFKRLLQNEYNTLNTIEKTDATLLGNSLPQPLWGGERAGHYIFIEKFCPGMQLSEYICALQHSAQRTESIISSITGWLINLYRMTKKEDAAAAGALSINQLFAQAVQRYKESQDLSLGEEKFIYSFCEQEKERGLSGPTLQHGDFSPWNIVYDKKEDIFSILDWGYANLQGLPFVDLLTFLISYQAVISGFNGGSKSSVITFSFMKSVKKPLADLNDFTAIFYKNNWLSDLAEKSIRDYCAALNIEKRRQQELFLIFILRHLYYRKDFLTYWLEKGNPFLLN